jgi:hypothetical protein
LVAALVRSDCPRGSQNDIQLAATDAVPDSIGTVARGISRTKERDCGRAQRRGKMQRTGIATNDARCVAEKRHKLLKGSIVRDGIGIPAGALHLRDEVFFARTKIHDAPVPERLSDFLAEGTETIRGPTLRPPAPAGTQYDIAIDGETP